MATTKHRRAFSLVELLVVITLIVMLVAMMATALNAARANGARQKTRASIAMINEILQRHFRATESISSAANASSSGRGAAIRRQITADMPDSWNEVEYLKNNPTEFSAARHRGYVATRDALVAQNAGGGGLAVVNQNASAECLFMIIMQGGLADCLDCAGLSAIPVGDTDADGAPEFLDAWGQPIRYVLWPVGFELPIGELFFDQTIAPFDGTGTSTTGGTMRPLVLSAGPSKNDSTRIVGTSYLNIPDKTTQCGSPTATNSAVGMVGGWDGNNPDYRGDNITNFDSEVKQ